MSVSQNRGGSGDRPNRTQAPVEQESKVVPRAPSMSEAVGPGRFNQVREDREQAYQRIHRSLSPQAPSSASTPPAREGRPQWRERIERSASGPVGGGAGAVKIPQAGGAPLPSSVSEKMGPKLGADLSGVRVHTGGESAHAAEQLGARAFTIGNDVHFNAGQFQPGSKDGDRLIAHELTHVAQGQKSAVQRKEQTGADDAGLDVSKPGDPAEVEAEAIAGQIVDGEQAHDGVEQKSESQTDKSQKDKTLQDKKKEKKDKKPDAHKHAAAANGKDGAHDRNAAEKNAGDKGAGDKNAADKGAAEKSTEKSADAKSTDKSADAKSTDAKGTDKSSAPDKGGDKASEKTPAVTATPTATASRATLYRDKAPGSTNEVPPVVMDAKKGKSNEVAPIVMEANAKPHDLTKEELSDLDWAGTVGAKVQKAYNGALAKLNSYANSSPDVLKDLKSQSLGRVQQYEKQFNKVNDKINSAIETSQLQFDVIATILSLGFDQLPVGEAIEAIGEAEKGGAIESGLKELFELTNEGAGIADDVGDSAGMIDAAKKGVGVGAGDVGTGLEDPLVKKLAFFEKYSRLQSISGKLLPLANKLAGCGPGIGALNQKIKDQKGQKTDPTYPVKKMREQAGKAYDLVTGVASACEAVPRALAAQQQMVARLQATAPKSDKEVEIELWVKWVAGLDKSNLDSLGLGKLEKYFKANGIWNRLGVDPTWSLGSSKEAIAVYSARAQSKVLEHRGEAVTMNAVATVSTPAGGTLNAIQLSGIPWPLPARMESGKWKKGGQAMVINAEAFGDVDAKVLAAAADEEDRVNFLLKHFYITVVLRSNDDVDAALAKGAG
jgi:hypothetical protein